MIYGNRNQNRKHDTFKGPKQVVWQIKVGYYWVLKGTIISVVFYLSNQNSDKGEKGKII